MKPTRVTEILTKLFETRWSAMLWGPPGVGKSSIVKEVAQMLAVPLIDIRAALLDPTDIRGIPAIENGRAIWCPPTFLPREKDKPGILFFDELSAAPPLVQASLYQLTLDRRVGEYKLPDGWRIVAAGNRLEDRSIAYRMPAALANRFVHIDFELDYGDWRAWAVQAGIHPMIIAFLGFRRELLFDMRQADRGFPTPRSWEITSDALRRFEDPLRKGQFSTSHFGDVIDVLIGIVGEGAATEFLGYCRSTFQEAQLRQILEAPDSAVLPTGLGDIYALVSYLVARAKEPGIRAAAAVILQRVSPEFGVLLVNDTHKVYPAFIADPKVRSFVQRHANAITPTSNAFTPTSTISASRAS